MFAMDFRLFIPLRGARRGTGGVLHNHGCTLRVDASWWLGHGCFEQRHHLHTKTICLTKTRLLQNKYPVEAKRLFLHTQDGQRTVGKPSALKKSIQNRPQIDPQLKDIQR